MFNVGLTQHMLSFTYNVLRNQRSATIPIALLEELDAVVTGPYVLQQKHQTVLIPHQDWIVTVVVRRNYKSVADLLRRYCKDQQHCTVGQYCDTLAIHWRHPEDMNYIPFMIAFPLFCREDSSMQHSSYAFFVDWRDPSYPIRPMYSMALRLGNKCCAVYNFDPHIPREYFAKQHCQNSKLSIAIKVVRLSSFRAFTCAWLLVRCLFGYDPRRRHRRRWPLLSKRLLVLTCILDVVLRYVTYNYNTDDCARHDVLNVLFNNSNNDDNRTVAEVWHEMVAKHWMPLFRLDYLMNVCGRLSYKK